MSRAKTRRNHVLRLSCVAIACMVTSVAFAAPPQHRAGHPKPATTESVDNGPGTTIVGGEQSPIGLYITPWKNAYAEPGLYQPEKHRLQVKPEAIDPDTFHRKNVYYDTITAYREAELAKSRPQPAKAPTH